MPEMPKVLKIPKSLIFVGNFNHHPNTDAMRYFCGEIFPLVLRREPNARLKIIGADPPEDLKRLASDRVEVLGHVSDLSLHMLSSCISVAPIRYGAGLKVKIGEAMSYGLPVVTSSVGSDGFSFTSDHVLIAGDAREFANAILHLFGDVELCRKIGSNGREFIRNHFSEEAVSRTTSDVFDRIEHCRIKKAGVIQALRPRIRENIRHVRENYDRYVGWRFRNLSQMK